MDASFQVLMCLDGYGEVQTMDAEQKGDLQNYVIEETKKDNRIEFVGFLNEQQVSQLLQSADS